MKNSGSRLNIIKRKTIFVKIYIYILNICVTLIENPFSLIKGVNFDENYLTYDSSTSFKHATCSKFTWICYIYIFPFINVNFHWN